MLLVFVGLFLCVSKRGGNQKSDYASATWIFTLLCGVAFALNCIVQFGIGRDMNMFFVGPGNSPIIVFKQFPNGSFGMSTHPFTYSQYVWEPICCSS